MIAITYINAEDNGGNISAEVHVLEVKADGKEEIHKFEEYEDYENPEQQSIVMNRVLKKVQQQARKKVIKLKFDRLHTNNK